jgi:CheY-like chemotaxis protein
MTTILVIEENADFCTSLVDWLTLKNFSVLQAADGVTGLRLAEQAQPDLILCNLNLHKIDGLSVLRAIRYNPLTSQMPFLLISSSNAYDLYEQFQPLQPNGYLEIGKIWSQLVCAIKTCLK